MSGAASEDRVATWPGLGACVDAYESAWARHGAADPADHAPPPGHPGRLAVLCELVRVDLEYRWDRGDPRRLDHYRERFPDLFDAPELVREMAFEEFRVRDLAGDRPDPAEYRERYGLEGLHASGPPGPAQAGRSDGAGDPDGMAAAASAYLAYRRDGAGPDLGLDARLESSGVPAEHAELLRRLDREDPHAAERLAEAISGLPRVGGTFLGFKLCGELGRGAFGRVFLARQGDLADRPVALKVSADVAGETNALARLQHTNVVPVYSVHRRGPYQAVCMPYLGATTLADSLTSLRKQPTLPGSGAGLLSTLRRLPVDDPTSQRTERVAPATQRPGEVGDAPGDSKPPEGGPGSGETSQIDRLRESPYVPAVLWLVARVAGGLAHAHQRGILHRDLKPANILFADDGEPLLLDFNLAADLHRPARAGVALVGGTLPYMAPEQLRAFRDDRVTLDARSDVYALGVILYELLTGSQPFPSHRGPVDDVLPRMIADREGPTPDPRARNPLVSPATAAIVRHCLECDPDRRYATARSLQEDLQRQLDDLPLRHVAEPSMRERARKWARRHPRLTSATSVAVLAGLLFLGLATAFLARHRRYEQAEAAAALAGLAGERSEVFALLGDPEAPPGLRTEGLRVARAVAARYGVGSDPGWTDRPPVRSLSESDRARLRAGLGEIFTLAARALAGPGAGAPALAEAESYLAAAARCSPEAPEPRALLLARAEHAEATGREATAADWRRRAEAVPPGTPRERLLAVADRAGPDDRRRLRAFLDAAEALGPGDVDAAHWLILGNWSGRLGRADDAIHCYGVAIALEPRSPWAYFNRGLVRLEAGEAELAARDFDRVVGLRPGWAEAYFNRALARLAGEAADAEAAVADLDRCLSLDPGLTRAHFVRSRARTQLGDLMGAQRDQEAGLAAKPRDAMGFVARGLARLPGDPDGALADFDAALALDPRDLNALQDKASVLSELRGRPEEAVVVLSRALEAHPASAATRSGRAVLEARLGHRDQAHRDARAAVELSDTALTQYQAACAFALTSAREPADRPEALRRFAEALRQDPALVGVAATDPDLAAVRNLPEFRRITAAVTAFRAVAPAAAP